jgi:hypothetical protein
VREHGGTVSRRPDWLLALIENDQFGSSNLTSLACAD